VLAILVAIAIAASVIPVGGGTPVSAVAAEEIYAACGGGKICAAEKGGNGQHEKAVAAFPAEVSHAPVIEAVEARENQASTEEEPGPVHRTFSPQAVLITLRAMGYFSSDMEVIMWVARP
jgi:hypothetical protein